MVQAASLRKEWLEALEQLLHHSLYDTKHAAVWQARVDRIERIARRNSIRLSVPDYPKESK